jgi:acyl dehydratase
MKIADLQPGLEVGPSDWREVTQEQVNQFADATGDHQWLHVDPVRAKDGPFGGPIAHGYLTLALLAPAVMELLPVEDASAIVNYGAGKVRFPAAVPVGSRLRVALAIQGVEEVKGGVQPTIAATIEREGGDRPVCTAELLYRYLR